MFVICIFNIIKKIVIVAMSVFLLNLCLLGSYIMTVQVHIIMFRCFGQMVVNYITRNRNDEAFLAIYVSCVFVRATACVCARVYAQHTYVHTLCIVEMKR